MQKHQKIIFKPSAGAFGPSVCASPVNSSRLRRVASVAIFPAVSSRVPGENRQLQA